MPELRDLHEGDEIACHCGRWHRLYRRAPPEAWIVGNFLYFDCSVVAGLYFAGSVGDRARRPTRPSRGA